MDFDLDDDQQQFLRELREFLDERFPEPSGRAFSDGIDGAVPGGSYISDDLQSMLDDVHGFTQALFQRGYRGVDWPVEYGGLGRSPIEQWLFLEEMAYRRLPSGGPTVRAVGRTLMVHGTPAQKARYLPGILDGSVEFALGYTEPEAGSDLSSLSSRAVRSGASYVINGQKIFTTNAHRASHLWLAVRTSPEPGAAGISMLITPMDTPGITVTPMISQSGERTNVVFLDDVRVPFCSLVGEENGGWTVIRTAVAFERIQTMSDIARTVQDLLDWFVGGARELDAGERRGVARLVADLEQARVLFVQTADRLAHGQVPVAEAAIAKVWSAELRERVATTGMDLLGDAAQIATGSPQAPLDGEFEALYRYFPVRKIAGGANPILRDLIASSRLHLPRK